MAPGGGGGFRVRGRGRGRSDTEERDIRQSFQQGFKEHKFQGYVKLGLVLAVVNSATQAIRNMVSQARASPAPASCDRS